ncbi:MAG: transposase [Gaiellaceae bacterium]
MPAATVSSSSRAIGGPQVEAFLARPLEGDHPYLWLDAKQVKVRGDGHVRSKALVIAYAAHETGRREVIGLDLGEVDCVLRNTRPAESGVAAATSATSTPSGDATVPSPPPRR